MGQYLKIDGSACMSRPKGQLMVKKGKPREPISLPDSKLDLGRSGAAAGVSIGPKDAAQGWVMAKASLFQHEVGVNNGGTTSSQKRTFRESGPTQHGKSQLLKSGA